MSQNRDILDAWEGEMDEEALEAVERQLVGRHDGSVVHVPTSVAASLLGYLLSSIEEDLEEHSDGEVDFETHQQFVYAYQLNNCVHDEWNGKWSGDS